MLTTFIVTQLVGTQRLTLPTLNSVTMGTPTLMTDVPLLVRLSLAGSATRLLPSVRSAVMARSLSLKNARSTLLDVLNASLFPVGTVLQALLVLRSARMDLWSVRNNVMQATRKDVLMTVQESLLTTHVSREMGPNPPNAL